jgi:hypothetical protein
MWLPLQARPDDFRRLLNLGVLHFDRGEWREAIAEYQAAMRLRPDAAQPLVNASLAYNRLGQKEKAEEALLEAIRRDPGNSSGYLNLGLLLAEKRQLPEAEAALRRTPFRFGQRRGGIQPGRDDFQRSYGRGHRPLPPRGPISPRRTEVRVYPGVLSCAKGREHPVLPGPGPSSSLDRPRNA